MKYKWLSKNKSDKLIIFFNGWGMDEIIVSRLDTEDYDVVVLYDYNNLNLDIDLSQYREKHVVAWSMGVMVATLFNFGKLKTKTALCGTPYTVDDEYGIPEKIYNLTLRTFSEKTVQKFMERMFLNKPETEKFSNRELESLKTELEKMAEYKPNNGYKYTKSIVADSDVIIPVKNQKNFWRDSFELIHSGHCPFENYKSWSEIIG
ncbi:MAG: DUF452 family protein [Cyanobacteria bacterium RUI128]|nr:DUF452 family protein [Cyanobacteria bacterium RUI128]